MAGDWAAAGERDAAQPGAEDEEDGDAFGDFEDLETGVYTHCDCLWTFNSFDSVLNFASCMVLCKCM